MATAISARDMINQVMQRCPTNTPIPNEVFTKNPSAKVSAQYLGTLKLKHVVQKRLI